MRPVIVILLMGVLLSACGPNAEQIAQAQQRRDDSIAASVRQQTTQNIESQERNQRRLAALKKMYANAQADLDVANDQMNHIKAFHFMRTDGDRENQIKNQDLRIQALTENIEKIKTAINQVQ